MPDQSPTATARVEQLDLATVIAVWHAVSGEMVREKLLERLSCTAIEHAGAQRALLILPHGSELRIEAEASSGDDGITVRVEEQAVGTACVPISIVRYVVRTGEPVIVADASAPNAFSTDDYVASKPVRSVLCLPLLNQGELLAVLYLENNLAPDIFTPGRVEILKVLAAAAAISIETSRRFQEIAQREAERKVTEEQLRRTATYLTDAQRLAHTGAWVSDAQMQPLYWSEEVFRIFGFDPQRGLPSLDPPLQRIHAEDREKFLQAFQKTIREKVDVEVEYRVVLPDGTIKYVRAVAHPVLNPNGELVEAAGTIIDITEHKLAEEALRRTGTYLANAQALTHTGTFAIDATKGEPIYWSEEMFQLYGFDPEQGLPTQDQWFQRIHPQDRESVKQHRDRLFHDKVDIDAEFRFLLPDGTVRHAHARAHPVLDTNGRLVEEVGAVVDITERKRAEETLRRNEAYLADAQRLTHTGSWAYDVVSSHYVYMSEECFRIFGISPQEQSSPNREMISQLIHPDDRDGVWGDFDRSLREKVDVSSEFRILLPDGTVKQIHAIRHPVLNDAGDVVQLVGTAIDVTERKRAEEALRRSQAYLAEGQRLTHTGSWASDCTGRPLYWSRELFRIYGFDPQQGLPTPDQPLQRTHPEDLNKLLQAFDTAIHGKVDIDVEFRVVLPDRTVKYVHGIGHPVLNANGEVVEMVGTAVDITERRRAEEALREKEECLRLASSAAQLGIFEWDIPSDTVRWQNERMFELFGRTPAEGPLTRQAFDAVLEPEDRPAFGQALTDAMRSDRLFTLANRIRGQNDGQQRWIEFSGRFDLAPDGSPKRLLGVIADITERKRGEEAVRQSEKQLRGVIENIPVMAYTALRDGSTEFVNRRWLEYTGLTAEQTGLYRLNSMHPDDREAHIAKWQASITTGEPFENEVRHCGADGQYRWFLVRGIPLQGEHGQILKWFGTLTDIEDRKKAEERLRNENVALREELDKASMFDDVVGTSPALRGALAAVAKVAPMDATVLLTGETGTGKELIARAIHKKSLRSSGPFVSVNCAAIPQSLIASELFGHEKGAFTGALQRRLGRFELADRGTIFLDEVGDLPLDTQIALLRVLQEKEFERVGSPHPIHSDARIIAATNRDLEAAIAAGTFRKDLFYRLSVFPIRVPPLRERREDISLLIEYFIHRFARKANKRIAKVEKRTLHLLQSFSWPGNVRELQNLIERAVIICETDTLTVDQNWFSPIAPEPWAASGSLARKSAAEEREIIQEALSESKGKIAGPWGAAAKLGIPASTLESKIRLLRIDKYHFRKPPAAE